MALQVPRDGLEQKLQKVSQSQQSIESVSSFCIFYHKDARGVVSVWDQQFYTAPTDRKIALLYLANHILQEGRKKSTGFQEEFFKVLPGCITHLAKSGDEKTKRVISRLVNVWEERRVFGTRHIKAFKDVLGATASSRQPKQPTAAAPAGNAAITAAAVPKLGPVDDALSAALAKAADAAAKGKGFTSSWSQVSSAALRHLQQLQRPVLTAAYAALIWLISSRHRSGRSRCGSALLRLLGSPDHVVVDGHDLHLSSAAIQHSLHVCAGLADQRQLS